MAALNSILIVPILSMVVLGALLVSLSRSMRSMGVGTAGVFGVLIGGPLTIVLLGPNSSTSLADEKLVKPSPSVPVEVEPKAGRDNTVESDESSQPRSNRPGADLQQEPAQLNTVDAGESSPLTNDQRLPSLAPAQIVYPADWPEWIDAPPSELDGWEVMFIDSGPHERRSDARQEFIAELENATRQFINEYLDASYASALLNYDLRATSRRFLDEQYVYEGTIDSPSVGPMHVKYALVAFDQQFRDEISGKWATIVARSRLLQTALIGGAVIGLLGVLFCYLRLDLATRGFYTGRLQFVALMAILALIATGALVARWVPWM